MTIRTRIRADLDNLREKYLPSLSPTVEWGGCDYRFRAQCSHAEFAQALGEIAKAVHYPNFKNSVKARQGRKRAVVYREVWAALQHLERYLGG
ncbi:MAG: hypothetical protein ACLQBD_29565 [Syntrophobacteraceae bacterium]